MGARRAGTRERGVRPNEIRHFEQSLEAVAEAPRDEDGKLDLIALVDDRVFGHAFLAAEAGARTDAEDDEAAVFCSS